MRTPEQREREREAQRRRRAADPEKYRQLDRERGRRYYAANRDKEREARRRRRAADPERYREYARRYRVADPEKYREAHRRRYAADPDRRARNGRAYLRKHGLYPEGWHTLWTAQDGCCYLCEDPLPDDPAKVHIDHDHRCCGPDGSCRSCRRGLAHPQCNQAIGLLGEDPARLRRIAANLAKAKRRIGRLPKPPTLFDLEKP